MFALRDLDFSHWRYVLILIRQMLCKSNKSSFLMKRIHSEERDYKNIWPVAYAFTVI